MLQNPIREKITRAFNYSFAISNNKAEYEALITGLRMDKDLYIKKIVVFYYSQLVVNQITKLLRPKDLAWRHTCN